MHRKDLVTIENKLAYKMLEESTRNNNIKNALYEISLVLINQVINPLRDRLSEVTKVDALAKPYQELFENMAAEHSAERRQYGALMPEFESSEVILTSMDLVHELLDRQEQYLRNIHNVSTVDDMVVAIKIIVELGYTHYEAPESWHHTSFKEINELISTTKEELDIRVFRSELGQPPQLALTHGIGRTEDDLGLKSEGEGYNAGKAAFGIVSMKSRLTILCQQYDNDKSERAAEKMTYYHIPLDKNSRMPIEHYANKWETFFEKLVKDPKTNQSLPLIASVSRATTRLIVTLQDLGAFNKPDNTFDFEKAQIIANCMMGFIVHAGHHSITEVAEVYNRLLDYVAISQLEATGQPQPTESKMPYYRIGNYHSFFHKSYANTLLEEVVEENISTNKPKI